MELHQLKCFIELSKFQNVSLTAEHLNISQPALSKTISLLESELGVKLFDRVGRRIRLNDHGRMFARYAETVIETLKEGTRNVRQLEYQPRGTISLGLFSYVNLIADCIRDFTEEYPLVKFELYSSKSQYTIDNFENLDFTLSSSLNSTAITREGFLESFPIAEEQYVLAIAPELLEHYFPDTPEDELTLHRFHPVPFLAMANNLMFSDVTYILCQQAGFTPNITLRTNDFATKLHMTALGHSASLIPEICIPVFESYRPDLKFLRLPDMTARRTIRLGRKRSTLVSQTCETFWNYTKAYYGA